MSVGDVIFTSSTVDYPNTFSTSFPKDDFGNRFKGLILKIASYLTDPFCKVHELFYRAHLVDYLNPTSYKVVNFGRKFFLLAGVAAFTLLSVVTTLPGIALRYLVASLQKDPFIYYKGNAPDKVLPGDRSFSLLSWNICCTSGGFSITDGGVMPWSFRIDRVVDKIVEKNADVNCLYEIFDTNTAFCIFEKLKDKGYSHFYLDIGPKAIGVPSGILVASKYAIKNPEFTAYPQDMLVGRTKNAAKGVFSFDLASQNNSFARIFSTHMQHSEEPAFPTNEEIEARRRQMQVITDKIDRIRDRCVVLTGDLNLDDNEYLASSWQGRFQKGDLYVDPVRTWGGDEFCSRLMGRRISGALNLDHTAIVRGSARSITTSLVETGFEASKFKPGALSDHAGLLSNIAV